MEIREVHITRILNPTSIDLGEYVINPYKGCSMSCIYCYVRYNRVTLKDKRCWGEYVDVRANAPELLKRELSKKKPRSVLLGSTTECFQPLEKTWQITQRVLEILNEHRVFYTILTRSPLIIDSIHLLKKGYCRAIYFTINRFDASLKKWLEPQSASFEERIRAIRILLKDGITVIPYFSPLLPFISDLNDIFFQFEDAARIEFEGLNFNLGNIDEIIKRIGKVHPQWGEIYQKMATDQKEYEEIFGMIKKEIIKQAIRAKRNHHIFIHKWCTYFKNTYQTTFLRNRQNSIDYKGHK